MKVLFITRKYPPQIGGMENLSYNLIKSIRCEKETIILNKKQYHLIWFVPYALIKALILCRKVDVVHIGDPVLSVIGFAVKLFYRKPIITTIHGLDITFTNKLYQWYLRTFMVFDKYICISKNTEKETHLRGFKNTVVIPVGIDPNKFAGNYCKRDLSKALGIDLKDQKILVTVGRLVKRKGVYWFIENVLPNLGDEVIYLVVGDGPERNKIKLLVRRLRLENRVFLLGRVSDDVLKMIYCTSDIFVMPNIPVPGDMEGFGIVALEAASAGLPVVASKLEGIEDAVQDGKNGLLVEPTNAEQFVEKIGELSNQTLINKKAIINSTKENYAWENVAKHYFDQFQQILEA